MAMANGGSGSGAKKPQGSGAGSTGSGGLCAVALNAMRTMMKDVPKDLNELTSIRRMALCKSYSAIGNMAAQLKSCTSAELKAGLANANRLCGAKKPVSTKKPGSTGKDKNDLFAAALGDCPALKKFYDTHKGKDGSLNVDIKPEQAKVLCAEFKSTSSKCRTHAVVGKMLGGNCGGAGSGAKDFCDEAPKNLVNLCKAEKQKCKNSYKEEAAQKACWAAKMKQLMAMANGSGAKKPQGSGAGSTGSGGLCAVALNAMRTMMKDVPKDLNKLTSVRRMALCKSYSAIGNMAAQLKSCTSAELKAGLANANRLCGAKKPVSTKKPGSTGKD